MTIVTLTDDILREVTNLIPPPAWATKREVDTFPLEANVTDIAKLDTGTQVNVQIERYSIYGLEKGDAQIGPDQICIRWDSSDGFGHELQQVDVYLSDVPAVIAALTLAVGVINTGGTK